MSKWYRCAFLLTFTVLIGCDSNSTAPNKKYVTAPAQSPAPPDPEVRLVEGTVEEIEKAVQSHKDCVVILEFWSSKSEPSSELRMAADARTGIQQSKAPTLPNDKVAWHGIRKAQFMAHKYEGYFLRVVAVNVDGLDKKDATLEYLKKQDAKHLTSFVLKDPAAAKEKFGFTGTTPHQVVFNKKGEKVWMTGEKMPSNFKTMDDLIFITMDK